MIMKSLTTITIADIVSFISAFFGFWSVIEILYEDLFIASLLILGAGILDFFDGKIARYFKCANEFGKNIDSFCDILSLGVAPAFFCSAFLPDYLKLLPFLIVLGGIFRLARFHVIKQDKFFIGMPITANGFLIPILYFLGLFNSFTSIILSLVLPALMTNNIKIKKIL